MRKKSLIAAVCMASVFVLTACGQESGKQDGTRIAQVGNPQEIKARILEAEATRKQTGRKLFCQQRWRGPEGPRRFAARLVLNRSSTRPSGRLFAEIENLGTDALAYGATPNVDQLIDGRWRPRKFVQDGVAFAFPFVRLELKRRESSTCLEVPASGNWRHGLYRVWFSVEGWRGKSGEPTLTPVAYFRVS